MCTQAAKMVCQGLQSCLEPGFLEPRAIIDKLANVSHSNNVPIWCTEKPIISLESQEHEHEKESKNDEEGDLLCWSFIQQSLLNNNNNNKNLQGSVKEVESTDEVYVHPLAKRCSSTLSTQSLEMCTEGLGSETGSNNVDDEIMADLSSLLPCEIQSSSSSSSSNNNSSSSNRRGRIQQRMREREYYSASFPPPLTQISGKDGIQLRSHREGGRLVLKAVPFSHNSCFRAERIEGRLRLFSLSKDEDDTNTNDSRSVEYTDDCRRVPSEEEEEEEEEEDEEECILGSSEIESEEFARPSSRCKEEGPRNNNWEPVWVAIS